MTFTPPASTPEYTGHEQKIHPPSLAGTRVGAALIDLAILGVGFFVCVALESGVAWAGFVVAVFLYYFLSEVYLGGRTPGKVVAGLRVARPDGAAPSVGQVFVRTLLRAVDVLPALYVVGAVFMVFTKREQRLGDLVAGTVVVRARKRRE